jgi:hypothetical protein
MEVNAEQYRKLSGLGQEPTEEQIILALLGKPKGKLTLKEIDELDFTKFQMPEVAAFPNLIFHNGKLYGKQDLQDMTFGLYVDLVEQAKDIQTNMILLMAMLWRPVTKIGYWSRIKAYFAAKTLLSKSNKAKQWGVKLLASVKYQIEDYDTLACMKREDEFRTMPGSIAAYTTTFFLITSQVLVAGSLRSLKSQLETVQSELTESLKKISQDGDGTPTSGSLQEKGQ